jgi:hypothetical protein
MNFLKDYWFLIVAGFAAAGWVAHAEVSHQSERSTKELVKILAERHIAEDAKEDGIKEGERKTLEKLCREGKLEARDCPDE